MTGDLAGGICALMESSHISYLHEGQALNGSAYSEPHPRPLGGLFCQNMPWLVACQLRRSCGVIAGGGRLLGLMLLDNAS